MQLNIDFLEICEQRENRLVRILQGTLLKKGRNHDAPYHVLSSQKVPPTNVFLNKGD